MKKIIIFLSKNLEVSYKFIIFAPKKVEYVRIR